MIKLTGLLITLLQVLPASAGGTCVYGDSIKVVKGQVSDYFIPVNNEYTVEGIVRDAEGKPVPGATFMFFASPKHSTTDKQGYYRLSATDTDLHLYVYAPGKRLANVWRTTERKKVDIRLLEGNNVAGYDGVSWVNGTNYRPRRAAQATRWYTPGQGTSTYCNPLNISYNYEPFNDNVKRGGSFRSSADPMALTFKNNVLLFSTNQGGYHYSRNLSDWDFQTASFQRYPTDDDQCAPAAFVSGDTLFYTGSTYEGLPVWYTLHPETGRWRQAVTRNVLPSWDPCLFLDDDGRLYLYYGSSNEYPLKAVQLSRETFAPVSEIRDVLLLHPEQHGWERFGMNNDDELTLRPFTEGAYMTKHNGRYYLQYGAPGTEFKIYADGVYVSSSPLGPFTYQKLNPFSYKPGGFVQGAGHGGTFKDMHGTYWHVATCMLSNKYKFERRIALFPTYFDADGTMWSDTSFGDYPQRNADYTGTDRFTGWMLLSYGKPVMVSSTDSTLQAAAVTDENMRSYWAALTGNAGEWAAVDLLGEREIRALQVNFYDHKTRQTNRANDTYYQYRIWGSENGTDWFLVVDKSDSDRDAPHDYTELATPLHTRYLKVENLHMPGQGSFCLSEFRVFGKASGEPPKRVNGFTVKRSKADRRNALLTWQPVKGAYGYNIRYGVQPGQLHNTITVNGDTHYDFRGLDLGTTYYFAIEALGETGVSPISKTVTQ